MNLTLDEISLKNLDRYDGILIKDSKIREDYDVTIIGIIRNTGESLINPEPDTILNTSDTILLIGEVSNMDRFKANLPS